MTAEETNAAIRTTWETVQSEKDGNKKGKALEDLIVLLIRTIPRFQSASTRRQNELEEIDVMVQNNSHDPLWHRDSQYILFECKHWSKPVGAPELREFRAKIERRFGRCRLGFFVAPGGFAETFHTEQMTDRKTELLVVPIGPKDLARLATEDDRNAVLKELHARAITVENGVHK